MTLIASPLPTRRTPSGVTATRSSTVVTRSSRSSPGSGSASWTTFCAKGSGLSGHDRIAVRFQYEWHDDSGTWFRSYGNELWEFDADGLMRRREASINDVPIAEPDRRYFAARTQAERGQDFPLQ